MKKFKKGDLVRYIYDRDSARFGQIAKVISVLYDPDDDDLLRVKFLNSDSPCNYYDFKFELVKTKTHPLTKIFK